MKSPRHRHMRSLIGAANCRGARSCVSDQVTFDSDEAMQAIRELDPKAPYATCTASNNVASSLGAFEMFTPQRASYVLGRYPGHLALASEPIRNAGQLDCCSSRV